MNYRFLFFLLTLLLVLSLGTRISAQDNQLFSNFLNKYVKGGFVDYKNLVGDKQLDRYLQQLSETDPDKLPRNEKLSFWINTYNAFTIQIIRENYPIESINELSTGGKIIGHLLGKTIWDKEFITINNNTYSLNDIELKILRKMDEPRIHFAIVCASISCPALRNEAFEADKLETQLQEESVRFLTDKERNDFDLSKKTAYLSKIFDWFDEDFGENDKEILKFVSKFLPDNIKKDMLENTDKWEINYKDYNWNLNEIK